MGSIMGKAMDENMQKQQVFMLKTQQDMLERQIQMQNYMREQAMAMQLARSREMFNWMGSFYGTMLLLGIAGASRGKKAALVPMLPLTFILGYQADLCYGNKMDRIRGNAKVLLEDEYGLTAIPQGLPTVPLLDTRRQKMKE